MKVIDAILSVLISIIVSYFAIVNFSKNRKSKKSFIIYFLIMLPFFLIINIYFTGIIKLISILILTTIAIYFSIFDKSLSNALYYAFVYEIFVFIVEILMSIIYVGILKFTNDIYESFPLSMFVFSIFNSIIIYLISKIKFIDDLLNKFNIIIVKRKYEMFYVIILFVLMALIIAFNGYNLKNNSTFYINVGMTIFAFITLIYIIYKDFKSDRLENNYNEMMEYVQKYEKIINEQGKKNHEYNNQLTVIKGYSKNPKKLEEYINSIIEDHKCGQNYTIRQLSNFPDGGIKGLIYHKLSKMEDNKIKYYLYIDGESKDIFEKKFDLKTYQDITKLLGVFLDNAIDASKEAKEKEIEIDIKNEDNSIVITISNTYNDKIDKKQIGKKGFTTKGKGHGYGLSIVKDINKHNDNIETFNDIEEDKFTQTILIYYK